MQQDWLVQWWVSLLELFLSRDLKSREANKAQRHTAGWALGSYLLLEFSFSPCPVSGFLQEAVFCVVLHMFLSLASAAKCKHLLQGAFQVLPFTCLPSPWNHQLSLHSLSAICLLCGCSAIERPPFGLGIQ